MLLEILFFILFALFAAVGFLLPGFGDIPLLLPWGIDGIFSHSVQMFYYFAQYNWPVVFPMQMALIYLGFELVLLFFKLILGSRTPGHTT